MKTPDDSSPVRLSFYITDPDSFQGQDCDTFYETDRDSWIVQGKKRGPEVAAQLVALADHETFVEISGPTVDLFVKTYVKENYGVDLSGRTSGDDQPG